MEQTVPNLPPDYYTAPFRLDKLDKFLGSENKQSFFSRSQRSRLVFEILSNTIFGREKKGEVGIDRLVSEGAMAAAYPLHDVRKSSNQQLSSSLVITGGLRVAGRRPAQPGAEHETDLVPVLGSVGSVVQISTPGPHQRLFRREDCHLLRLAGILHWLAPAGLCSWRGCLSLRPPDSGPELRGCRGVRELCGKVRTESIQSSQY